MLAGLCSATLVLEVPHFGAVWLVLDCSKRLVLAVLISDAGWTVLDCRTMAGLFRQVSGRRIYYSNPFYCCLFVACGRRPRKHCLRLRSAIRFILFLRFWQAGK